MLELQTAYGLTFLPDFRFTLVTHLSNFFEFRPFFTPLGMICVYSTSPIKIRIENLDIKPSANKKRLKRNES